MKRTLPLWLYECELERMVEFGRITCVKIGKTRDGRTVWTDPETDEEYVIRRKGLCEFVFTKS